MADIINLRLARKARTRANAEAGAGANRARHGQSKAERARQAQEAQRLARRVDGARLDQPTPQPPPPLEPE